MTTRPALFGARLALALALGFAGGACSSKELPAPAGPAPKSASKKPSVAPARAPGILVGRFPEGTFGPRLALGEGRTLVWCAPTGADRGVYRLEVPFDSEPRGAEKVADFPEGLRTFEVVDRGGEGTLVVLLRRVGATEYLDTLLLPAGGGAPVGPQTIVESNSEILWFDVASDAKAPLLVWASAGREGAELFVARSLVQGAPKERIADRASAWQLASFQDEPHVAWVEGTTAARRVLLRRLAEAAPKDRSWVLDSGLAGALDLDMSASRERLVVAYSAQGSFENRLRRVVVDRTGKAGAPAAVTPPRGDQTLVRLVSSKATDATLAVWEEPARRLGRGRSLLVGRLDGDGRIAVPEGTLALESDDPWLPAFAATPAGVWMITESTRLLPGRAEKDAPAARLAYFWDPARPRGASALEVSDEIVRPASLVWDLACASRGCSLLAAGPGPDALVRLLELDAEGQLEAPFSIEPEMVRPTVVSEEVIGEVPDLVALRGARSGTGVLLSRVTYFDDSLPYETPTRPAPDGRLAPVRALLQTEYVEPGPDDTAKRAAETVVSYRARSLAGVAQATPAPVGAPSAAGAPSLLAWAALDGKIPQLFLTLVDARGKKLSQKMHKHPEGEITDVVATATESGYLVAWVDGRDNGSEIHAAVFDAKLELAAPERKITTGALEPTGLTLARVSGRALLVWSDSVGAARAGYGDLHVAALDEKTGAPVADVRRVLGTELHSHSPTLTVLDRDAGIALLGWLEAEPNASGSDTSALFLAELDRDGRSLHPATEVRLPGQARGFSAVCAADDCRVVASLDRGERGELWGLVWTGRGKPTVRPLSVLEGPASQSVPPLLVDDAVFFVDVGRSGLPWLRRMRLAF